MIIAAMLTVFLVLVVVGGVVYGLGNVHIQRKKDPKLTDEGKAIVFYGTYSIWMIIWSVATIVFFALLAATGKL